MKLSSALIFTCCITLFGCNSVVLQKAKLQSVRRLSVASLFASERIPEVRGEGVLRKMDAESRLQIAEDALTAYQEAFASLGWEVTMTEEVVEKEIYKTMFRNQSAPPLVQGKASNAFAPRTFTPADIAVIWLPPEVEPRKGRRLARTDRDGIIDLAKALDVDGTALVQLRYCFRTFEKERQERVVITATSAMQIVDRKGVIQYATEIHPGCGENARGESTRSMEIMGEDWIYDPLRRDEIRRLFREASEAEAARAISSMPVTPQPRRRTQ